MSTHTVRKFLRDAGFDRSRSHSIYWDADPGDPVEVQWSDTRLDAKLGSSGTIGWYYAADETYLYVPVHLRTGPDDLQLFWAKARHESVEELRFTERSLRDLFPANCGTAVMSTMQVLSAPDCGVLSAKRPMHIVGSPTLGLWFLSPHEDGAVSQLLTEIAAQTNEILGN